MLIQTTRFGPVEVDATRLIHFGEGLVGFPQYGHFALIATGEQSSFFWLQATEAADLAFVVTNPRLFVPDYQVAIRAEDREKLDADEHSPLQLFTIVNKLDQLLTANLQGPIVVNAASRQALQLVLSDKRYTTRHPLIQLPVQTEVLSRTA